MLFLLPNSHIVGHMVRPYINSETNFVQVGRGGRLEKPVEAHRYVGLQVKEMGSTSFNIAKEITHNVDFRSCPQRGRAVWSLELGWCRDCHRWRGWRGQDLE